MDSTFKIIRNINLENDLEFMKVLQEFRRDGFLVLDLDLPMWKMDELRREMNDTNPVTRKLNPKIFHYNESPRIIEFWKQSELCKELATSKIIMRLAEKIYGRPPIPFSTINFIRSTEQPLHSDAIHFGSMPAGLLCGAWVALEDISKEAGPLVAVPGSHKFPEVSLDKLGLEIPKSPAQLKKNYSLYEEYVEELVNSSELGRVVFDIPAGCCVIWDSNLLHGAIKQNNMNLTRCSQVTHYHFIGAKYYNPLYTSVAKSQVAYRDVMASEIK